MAAAPKAVGRAGRLAGTKAAATTAAQQAARAVLMAQQMGVWLAAAETAASRMAPMAAKC